MGSGCADGRGRHREKGNHVQENPGSDRDLIAQVEDGKGGATKRGKSYTGSREELLGLPSKGRKCRREVEAGSQGRRLDGKSLRAWAICGGEEAGSKEREKRCRWVKD